MSNQVWVLLAFLFYTSSSLAAEHTIVLDGIDKDWQGVELTKSPRETRLPSNVDLAQVGLLQTGEGLFFMLKMHGRTPCVEGVPYRILFDFSESGMIEVLLRFDRKPLVRWLATSRLEKNGESIQGTSERIIQVKVKNCVEGFISWTDLKGVIPQDLHKTHPLLTGGRKGIGVQIIAEKKSGKRRIQDSEEMTFVYDRGLAKTLGPVEVQINEFEQVTMDPGKYRISRDRFLGTGELILTGGPTPITVCYSCPEKLSEKTCIMIIIHGTKRNAESYLKGWQEMGNSKGLLLLAPCFSKEEYPDYAQGIVNEDEQQRRFLFPIIEGLYEASRVVLKREDSKYFIFGHSGGGQFVHRMAMFAERPRFEQAFAANAGYYTFPDYSKSFPYGLKDIGLNEEQLKVAFRRPLMICTSAGDRAAGAKYLRTTSEAMDQGTNRYERADNFFDFSRKRARKMGVSVGAFKWQIKKMNGGHRNADVAKQLGRYLK